MKRWCTHVSVCVCGPCGCAGRAGGHCTPESPAVYNAAAISHGQRQDFGNAGPIQCDKASVTQVGQEFDRNCILLFCQLH